MNKAMIYVPVHTLKGKNNLEPITQRCTKGHRLYDRRKI